MKIILSALYLLMGIGSSIAFSQDFSGRTVIGKQHATEEIKKALANKNAKSFYDTLIKDKEMAIAIAEPILFRIYGKDNIIKQRPYESYMIDRCWLILGTLAENNLGGTFEIIINSKNAKVIKLIHGQ